MKTETVLQPSRWRILAELSKGDASATEVAKRIGSSVPNVTQQLKILTAYDLVAESDRRRDGVGKPKRYFRVKQSVANIAIVRPGFAHKEAFSPTPLQAILLNVVLMRNAGDRGPLIKFLFENDEVLEKCAVAYLKSSATDIEILLLTKEVDDIRKKYSNTELEFEGKKRKIVAWTHTLEEVNEGLEKGEKHFDIFTTAQRVIHDPKGEFNKVNK